MPSTATAPWCLRKETILFGIYYSEENEKIAFDIFSFEVISLTTNSCFIVNLRLNILNGRLEYFKN